MKYNVTIQRVINDNWNEEPIVVKTVRRFNGAINERDALVESTRANQINHNPDGNVIVGEGPFSNSEAVVSLHPDGDEIFFIIRIVEAN